MSRRNWGPRWSAACTILFLALAVGGATLDGSAKTAAAADNAAGEAAASKRSPRLPAHYAGVVTDKQRRQIADIQEEYAAQIQQKRDELKSVLDKQEAAISKLLSKDQRQQIEKLRTEARQKHPGSSTAEAGNETEMEDEAPTKGKPKSERPGKPRT